MGSRLDKGRLAARGSCNDEYTHSENVVAELLTTREAARLCGLGERTFWRHSHSGAAPAPVRIGGSTRYRRPDLLGVDRGRLALVRWRARQWVNPRYGSG